MSEKQEHPDERPADDGLVLLAERLLQEPEIVAWLGDTTAQTEDDDHPRAA